MPHHPREFTEIKGEPLSDGWALSWGCLWESIIKTILQQLYIMYMHCICQILHKKRFQGVQICFKFFLCIPLCTGIWNNKRTICKVHFNMFTKSFSLTFLVPSTMVNISKMCQLNFPSWNFLLCKTDLCSHYTAPGRTTTSLLRIVKTLLDCWMSFVESYCTPWYYFGLVTELLLSTCKADKPWTHA